MPAPLRILLIDQQMDALAALKRSLSLFTDLDFVGDAGFGPVAVTWARTLQPDIVLVAAEEPLARPLSTIRLLAQGGPTWTVVALSTSFDAELFRQLVLAGAGDVLARAAPPADIAAALVRARRADLERRAPTGATGSTASGTVLTVFGAKGGIGKTLVASNLALSLATETAHSVALVDLDLPFGDIALLLDLRPERDVIQALDPAILGDPERLQAQLTPGPGGVQVLPAPLAPDEARPVNGEETGKLLSRLAALYDFVVVDTPPGLNEITAAALDTSELTLLLTTTEVQNLRRTQACLSVLQRWEYSTHRVKLVLNRAGARTTVSEEEAESVLDYPITYRVTNDSAAMESSAYGRPLVLYKPDSPVSVDIRTMARHLAGLPPVQNHVSKRWSWRRLRPAALWQAALH